MDLLHIFALLSASSVFVITTNALKLIDIMRSVAVCQPMLTAPGGYSSPPSMPEVTVTAIHHLMREGIPLITLYYPFDEKYFYQPIRHSGQCKVRMVVQRSHERVRHIDSSFSHNNKATMVRKLHELLLYIVDYSNIGVKENSPLMSLSLYHEVPNNFLVIVYDERNHGMTLQYQVRRFCPKDVPICLVRGSYIPKPDHGKMTWAVQLKQGRKDFHGFRICYFAGLPYYSWKDIQHWLQRGPFAQSYTNPGYPSLQIASIFANAHNFSFDSRVTNGKTNCSYGRLYRNAPIFFNELGDAISIQIALGRAVGYHVLYTKEPEALIPWRLQSIVTPFTATVWLLSAVVLATVVVVGMKPTNAQESVTTTALAIVEPLGNYFSPSVSLSMIPSSGLLHGHLQLACLTLITVIRFTAFL